MQQLPSISLTSRKRATRKKRTRCGVRLLICQKPSRLRSCVRVKPELHRLYRLRSEEHHHDLHLGSLYAHLLHAPTEALLQALSVFLAQSSPPSSATVAAAFKPLLDPQEVPESVFEKALTAQENGGI